MVTAEKKEEMRLPCFYRQEKDSQDSLGVGLFLIITTNLEFGGWAEVFGNERMTAALLDRLTHRCYIVQIKGESYRFKESRKRKASMVK